MPTFLAKYLVKGDLVVSPELPKLIFSSHEGYNFEITNGTKDAEGNPLELHVIVVGECSEMAKATGALRDKLRSFLDKLSLVSDSRFQVEKPLMVIEWEEYQGQRRYQTYHVADAKYPPSPELVQEFITSVNLIDKVDKKSYVTKAMETYRQGLLADAPSEQHTYFWRALEILAEHEQASSAPIECDECFTPWVCAKCGKQHESKPIAKNAIGKIMERMRPSGGADDFRRQNIIRNLIIHGRTIPEKVSLEQATIQIAHYARKAIVTLMFPKPMEGLALAMGENILNGKVSAGPVMLLGGSTEVKYPDLETIPIPEISMTTRFNRE